jgi:hypothetical protein
VKIGQIRRKMTRRRKRKGGGGKERTDKKGKEMEIIMRW